MTDKEQEPITLDIHDGKIGTSDDNPREEEQ